MLWFIQACRSNCRVHIFWILLCRAVFSSYHIYLIWLLILIFPFVLFQLSVAINLCELYTSFKNKASFLSEIHDSITEMWKSVSFDPKTNYFRTISNFINSDEWKPFSYSPKAIVSPSGQYSALAEWAERPQPIWRSKSKPCKAEWAVQCTGRIG